MSGTVVREWLEIIAGIVVMLVLLVGAVGIGYIANTGDDKDLWEYLLENE